MLGFDGITFDPGSWVGRGVSGDAGGGTANGMTLAEIVEAYPYLETEDVNRALRYAAWLAEEQVLPAQLIIP